MISVWAGVENKVFNNIYCVLFYIVSNIYCVLFYKMINRKLSINHAILSRLRQYFTQ